MRFTKKVKKLWARGIKDILTRIIKKILLGKGIRFFERLGFHVLPIHYYSPVPSMRELDKNVEQWYKEGSFTGIDFNHKDQLKLLDNLHSYKEEFNKLDSYEQVLEQGIGEGYGEIEAHVLYAMVRHLKPRRVIEVGSGVSTFFSAKALTANKHFDSISSKLTCIEPYPWSKLKDITGDGRLDIIDRPVQAVDLDVFKTLGQGDILFIDSSHMVKIGSDVNYLYLEVLPNLNKGVIIHIHDIFFPYPSFNSKLWMFGEHRFWTEPALVQAFLTYNSNFRILLCTSYLHYKEPSALKDTFNVYDHSGYLPSSLWIEKIN